MSFSMPGYFPHKIFKSPPAPPPPIPVQNCKSVDMNYLHVDRLQGWQYEPIHVYLDVSPTLLNGTYAQVSMHRIAALDCSKVQSDLEANSFEINKAYVQLNMCRSRLCILWYEGKSEGNPMFPRLQRYEKVLPLFHANLYLPFFCIGSIAFST